ncbi:MAG: aminopeptidase P family protein [Firmicutes bacterium]|nr:aminopeptidase P family protein [Bacillota bacterium]
MNLPNIEIRYTPKEELTSRISRFQQSLLEKDIDGALILQKADLFYFSGTCQNAHLFIPAHGEPVLIVRKSLKRAKEESALDNIITQHPKDMFKNIINLVGSKGRIGLEMDVLPAKLFLKYQSALSPLEVVDASNIIRKARMIKSLYEIDRLRETARLNNLMFSEISNVLKEGITEVELASKLESVYRINGHQGAIRMRGFNQELFYGHLMSGWNLSYPSFFDGPTGGTGLNPSYPQSAGFKVIGRNEPVMVDYVGNLNGYMVDQARIFCIGSLPDKLVKAYDVALQIRDKVAEAAKPGVNGKDLFETAYNIAAKNGFQDHFMGYEDRISFIAHGIGIELDELPVLAKNFDMVLQSGMVFAMEPKFIFPEEGAVGIEDTFVVTDEGLEQISYFDDSIHCLPILR